MACGRTKDIKNPLDPSRNVMLSEQASNSSCQVALLARRSGRKRRIERTAANRAEAPRHGPDRGTPEQKKKRANLVGSAPADKNKSYLGDPLGLMKVKGWITHEQEQAGYKFAQLYARVFTAPRLTSPSFDLGEGGSPHLPWERLSTPAREAIERAEGRLLDLLGVQTKYGYAGGVLSAEEAAVLNRYVLTDSLPEWLQVPYRDESKLKSLKEFQAMCSAVKKLAANFGLE